MPSISARFIGALSLAGKVGNVSSLALHGAEIAGNAINDLGGTKAVGDLTSPIFDRSGNFLGTDDQGFSGKILFMDRSLYQIISGLGTSTISHKTALTFGTTVENMPFTQQSAIAIGNAFTDIDSRVNIPGFKMSELLNGEVSTYGFNSYEQGAIGFNSYTSPLDLNTLVSAPAATDKLNKTITFNLNNQFRYMINTVENVENLFVHEAGGHWVKGYDKSKGLHYKAYELQINDPTFKYTTPDFQTTILNAYENAKENSSW